MELARNMLFTAFIVKNDKIRYKRSIKLCSDMRDVFIKAMTIPVRMVLIYKSMAVIHSRIGDKYFSQL